jgi:hypothetical protein
MPVFLVSVNYSEATGKIAAGESHILFSALKRASVNRDALVVPHELQGILVPAHKQS